MEIRQDIYDNAIYAGFTLDYTYKNFKHPTIKFVKDEIVLLVSESSMDGKRDLKKKESFSMYMTGLKANEYIIENSSFKDYNVFEYCLKKVNNGSTKRK